ncbi:MAG: hypothetical protein ABH879_06715 [archaeon]
MSMGEHVAQVVHKETVTDYGSLAHSHYSREKVANEPQGQEAPETKVPAHYAGDCYVQQSVEGEADGTDEANETLEDIVE